MQMKKSAIAVFAAVFSFSLLLSGCDGGSKSLQNSSTKNPGSVTAQSSSTGTAQPQQSTKADPPAPEAIDYSKVKPNENGKIIVIMFHNFVESAEAVKGNEARRYTTTFDDFRKLLQTLYDEGFRLISMDDYLNNNISVPAGCKPIVFTFDDGTAGQFNLVEENGKLTANRQSAVGIMEEFNKAHPDFGLKGVFYVNLNNSATFNGKGTLAERLKYLIDKGFEIGNHTLNHFILNGAKSADKVQEEIGGNQKKMDELVPGYKMNTLALPQGAFAPKDIRGYVSEGSYQGVDYKNKAIMLVGAEPAFSPVSKNFNPLMTSRVRATGIKREDCDFAWWLEKLQTLDLYVSDGNPGTVAVPKSKEDNVDKDKLNGKQLIAY